MMNLTSSELLTTACAIVTFAAVILPPGYLAWHLVGRDAAPNDPFSNPLLWTLTLALPCSLLLTVGTGALGPNWERSSIALLLLVAAIVAWRRRRRSAESAPPNFPGNRRTFFVAAGLALYMFGMTTSLQVGHKLFEPVLVADWSIRIPLVAAAIHHGVPPGNPFFSLDGQLAPTRFYYFWYVLCAASARLVPGEAQLPARACLSASVFWAAGALLSTLLLALREFAGIRKRLPSAFALLLVLCCVMGIDILPSAAGLLTHPIHLRPEIEWWHEDRIPSFLGAILFAPHHIAGLVCCVGGFLLLHACSPSLSRATTQTILTTVLAAICFTAAVGTSTYIAFCFAIVGSLLAFDLVFHREWRRLGTLAGAALLATVLSIPTLHMLLSGPALQHTRAAPTHFFSLSVRELGDGTRAANFLTKRLLHRRIDQLWWSPVLGLPFALVFIPLEFGFLLFPLSLQIRQDVRRYRSGEPFTAGERVLWAVFLGSALPALFLSSEPTQGVNDLGRHAGLILRFVVVVWSTKLLLPFWDRLRHHQPLDPAHSWMVRAAGVFLILGLFTQLWQIVLDRTYLIFFDHTNANPEMPFAKDPDLAKRYFDLETGLAAVESELNMNDVVQSNMGSRFQPIVMLYSQRPFVAGDVSCELAFGGTPALCYPAVQRLQLLFGGPSDTQTEPNAPYHSVFFRNARAYTTTSYFLETCRDLQLAAVVAQDSDPAWSIPDSWVWLRQPVFTTPRIRIFRCPTHR